MAIYQAKDVVITLDGVEYVPIEPRPSIRRQLVYRSCGLPMRLYGSALMIRKSDAELKESIDTFHDSVDGFTGRLLDKEG